MRIKSKGGGLSHTGPENEAAEVDEEIGIGLESFGMMRVRRAAESDYSNSN